MADQSIVDPIVVHPSPFDSHEFYLSLAYERLDHFPRDFLEDWAGKLTTLDLSHNCFRDLSFLKSFTELKTLVLDRNGQLQCETFPQMANLEILWLNNCNIVAIEDWLLMVQQNCPNLKQLSMMCNPVGETVLNGVTAAEERKYRKWVAAMLPQLTHFDGVEFKRKRDNRRIKKIYRKVKALPKLTKRNLKRCRC